MKNCRSYQENLALYAYGELSGRDKAELEHHLVECDGCRQELETLERILGVVSSKTVPERSPAFWSAYNAKLQARLKAEQRAAAPRRMSIQDRLKTLVADIGQTFRVQPVPAYAFIAILLLAGFFVITRIHSPDPSRIAMVPDQTIQKVPHETPAPPDADGIQKPDTKVLSTEMVMSAELADALVLQELALLAELDEGLVLLQTDQAITREIQMLADVAPS